MTQPPWATLEHGGVVISTRAGKQELQLFGFMTLLALVWTVFIAASFPPETFASGWSVMALGVPLFWGIALLVADDLLIRRTLRLRGDTLILTVTRLGVGTPEHLPLAELTVTPLCTEGARGWTNIGVFLDHEAPDGRTSRHVVPLPGGQDLRDRAVVLAHLAWTVETLQAAVDRAGTLPPATEDPEQRQAIEALTRGAD